MYANSQLPDLTYLVEIIFLSVFDAGNLMGKIKGEKEPGEKEWKKEKEKQQ